MEIFKPIQADCLKLKVGDDMKVLLLNFNSNEFWVRDIALCEQISKLENDMEMCFNKTKRRYMDLNKIQPRELFACQMTNSGIWGRVEILSIRGQYVDVFFVDYGHKNIVFFKRIQYLPLPFKSFSPLAYYCKLYKIEMYPPQNIMNYFHHLIEIKKDFVIVCKLISNGVYFVDFKTDIMNGTFQNKNELDLHNTINLYSSMNLLDQTIISEDLEDCIIDKKALMKPNHKYQTVAKQINFLQPNIKIKILNIFHPNNFWVNIVSDPMIFKLKKLQDDMALHYNAKNYKVEFTPNGQMLYAGNCLLGETMVWCRLNILDIELSNMTCSALLVDHGIIIDRTLENLYSLESQFMMPFLAVCCCISNSEVNWSKTDIEKFKKYVDKSGILEAQAIKILDYRLHISIFLSEGLNLDINLLQNKISKASLSHNINKENFNSNRNNNFIPSCVEKNNVFINTKNDAPAINLSVTIPNEQFIIEKNFNSQKLENKSHQEEIALSKFTVATSRIINTTISNGETDIKLNNSKSNRKIIDNKMVLKIEDNARNPDNNFNVLKTNDKIEPVQYASQYRNIGIQDKFIIMHIESINCFYILFEDNKIPDINKNLTEYCKTNKPRKDQVVNEGNCVVCKSYNTFVRGCIIKVYFNSAVDIKCIDYGNVETVESNKFIPLSDSLIKDWPIQVFKVGIFSNDRFSLEAEKWFKENCLEKTFTLLFERMINTNDACDIDLKNFETGLDIRKKLLSLNNDLKDPKDFENSTLLNKSLNITESHKNDSIFIDKNDNDNKYLICQQSNDIPSLMSMNTPQMNNDITPKLNFIDINNSTNYLTDCIVDVIKMNTQVIVTHVISPSEFYVQNSCHFQVLLKLTGDMNVFYSDDNNDMYAPKEVGEIVAGYFDEIWSRGKVIEKLNNQQFKILFIDFGNTDNLSSKNLRILEKKFINFCSLHTIKKCSLLDALPKNGSEWSSEAIKWFKTLNFKLCSITSQPRYSGDVNQVSLKILENNINVFDEMIRLDHASKLDFYQSDGLKLNLANNLKFNETNNAKQCINNDNISKNIRQIDEIENLLLPGDGNADHIIESKHDEQTIVLSKDITKEVCLDQNDVQINKLNKVIEPNDLSRANINESSKINILILNCISPNDFYCQSIEIAKAVYECFQNYENPDENYKPLIGEICCVFHEEYQEWYRGKVINCKKNKASLFLIDYGEETEASFNNIGPLLTEFLINQPPAAIHCALSGIKPVTGASWSNDAINIFKNLVDEKIFTMQMPVNLTSDINPINLEYMSNKINLVDEFIQLGAAIPN